MLERVANNSSVLYARFIMSVKSCKKAVAIINQMLMVECRFMSHFCHIVTYYCDVFRAIVVNALCRGGCGARVGLYLRDTDAIE